MTNGYHELDTDAATTARPVHKTVDCKRYNPYEYKLELIIGTPSTALRSADEHELAPQLLFWNQPIRTANAIALSGAI